MAASDKNALPLEDADEVNAGTADDAIGSIAATDDVIDVVAVQELNVVSPASSLPTFGVSRPNHLP